MTRFTWPRSIAVGVCLTLTASACAGRETTVGFLLNDDACVLRPGALQAFGDVLDEDERRAIEHGARAELEEAFQTLPVTLTTDASAFWRIAVVRSLPARASQALPRSGESIALGVLGGGGTVACDVVARKALQHAPAGTTREQLIAAIGRGVGRTAVHELVHQMLGPASAHNDADTDSYEHGSSDRVSQFYGQLHWTTALPLLQQKLGTRAPRSER